MTRSADEIVKMRKDRVGDQYGRIQRYQAFYDEYFGQRHGGGGVRGSYVDGRPALQPLDEMNTKLRERAGAPNWIKPIIDDRVAVMAPLPTMTFDAESDADADTKRATLASRVIRGQYEVSRMAVRQTKAALYGVLFGDSCYTLDPLRPSQAKESRNPFEIASVKINVQDPRFAFPMFGTGHEDDRLLDLILYFEAKKGKDVAHIYPRAMEELGNPDKVELTVFYSTEERCIVLASGARTAMAFAEEHPYGFCPAEWAVNKSSTSPFGVSEIDQALDLHRSSQALYHLAMDAAIIGTFPPIHVHNPEHVGRFQYGPLARISTVEDGRVEAIQSNVNIGVPMQLLEQATGNLMKQTGTSPLRQEMNIQHANTSGRAVNAAQGPMEARLALNNILLGSALEWINAKTAMILYRDPEFKRREMTLAGIEFKGKRESVTFRGEDLGGLWHNHVQWSDPLGTNKHEVLVMYLQLFKEGLVSGRKVLEALGEDDPERMIEEAQLDRQHQQLLQQAAQQAGPGGPPGSPTAAADQGVALGAGAMPGGPADHGAGGAPPPGGPVQPPPQAQMPGFGPLAAPPGSTPGGATPVPDIWAEVQSAAAAVKLHGEVVGAVGTPRGILVTVTDHRDFAILKTALRSVAELVHGPGAKVDVKLADSQKGQ